jgi:DNA-binding beta-propeller fold protein YncE/tRNA A-37 threonylcarbamoyl transferase component Bud32
VSEQTPPAPGDFGVGSHVAGYRLDEQIGRGGMAVVYRAHDARLDRRVALKILAPELARDEEFRQRFIRESRAAAAVDHPNIIPIYEAGEADGVLFIAMRFVDGRDVQTLIGQLHPLPTARVCDIVTQVASALDAAHAHGLVHRDVKPGNMLRDATSGRAQPDHVYLSDFGLSKQSLGTSAALTSQGQFLGTLNYVAPEQIEGRPVDGRTDEYALACSTFEMLAGQPPFRRDDSLATMWAQLSDPPPSLTGMRPDLPAAVDGVIARALSKPPDDRYGTCVEFATALRQACGVRTGSTGPGQVVPGPGATRAVRPDELAAANAAGAASAAEGEPPGQPGATGRTDTSVPDASPPSPETSVTQTGMAGPAVGRASTPAAGAAGGGPPTQAGRVPGVGPTKPGLTDPMGDFGQLYRPPGPPAAPPRRRSRRTLAVVAAGVVVLAAAGGAYALLGGGDGGGGGGGGGHRDTTTTTRVLAPPRCTTSTAKLKPLPGVRTEFVQVGGQPFDVVVTPNHFGFVSLRKGAPLVVMNTAKFVPTVVQNVPLANPEGEALTHNGQYLLIAGDSGMTVFRVQDLEAGGTIPVGSLTSPGGKGALQVVPSLDDRFAFVALQNSGTVAVFNLHKALTQGFGPADFVGNIPIGSDPTGMAASPDGRYLYVVSGLANTAVQSGMGTLTIVNMHHAVADPGSSIVKTVNAGCGPARVITSPDGKDVWVTAGGGNTLEAFSADKLLTDTKHALIAKVPVGQIPLGLVLVSNGKRLVVADSNRDKVGTAKPGLAVIDVDKALAGQPAVLGTIKSGLAPRQFALEPNGKTLLVTNTQSGQVEAVNVGQLP